MLSADEIAHQRTLLQTYRGNLALYLRQQALAGGAAFVQPAVMHGIAESRAQIARIKRILRDDGVPVDDHPDDGDAPAQPARAEATPAQPAQAAPDRVRLRQALIERFNEEELRDLAFDLGIDYESLPGSGKAGKARELVAHAERHRRLDDLVATVRAQRPGALP